MVRVTRGVSILTCQRCPESMRFQNAARCIWSTNWPKPFANGASTYIGELTTLWTAAAGSKVWLKSPLGPKPTKFMRRGTITDRRFAARPEDGGKPTMVNGKVAPPTENDELKCGKDFPPSSR